jgi:hypothetical protein
MSKKVEVSADFLLEAYKVSSEKWKARFLAEMPDLLKPEIEITTGKFYVKEWNDGDYDIFRIDSLSNGKYTADYYFRNGSPLFYHGGLKNMSLDELLSDERYVLSEADQHDLQRIFDFKSKEIKGQITSLNKKLNNFRSDLGL